MVRNAQIEENEPGPQNKTGINSIPPNSFAVKNKNVNGRWEEVTFVNHPQVKYWHNIQTGERRWYSPKNTRKNEPKERMNAKNLPEGWTKYKHRNNTSTPPLYWYENQSGSTYWNLPGNNKNNSNTNTSFTPVFNQLDNIQLLLNKLENTTKQTHTGGRKKTRRGRKSRRRRN